MYNQLTEKDIQAMEAEIEDRKLNVRPKLLEAVKEARAQGDLSENFEYYAAKKEKNKNESRIRFLERMIKTAEIIPDDSGEDEIGVNTRVTVQFEDDGSEETYKLVTTMRGDSLNGLVSVESPIGKALLKHKAGDRVYVEINKNAGYYLIKDKEGSQTQTPPNSAYTSYILKVVGNTTAKTKLDVPELVKKVQENSKKDIEGNGWQDAADYNIDEVIPYKLTGTLPSNYAEYETYFYEFNDIMSAGLTFDKMSVKVTVDGTTLTADQDYSLIVHSDTNSFQVRFENLKAIQSVMITSTSQIVVEYKCRLNGNAVIAGNGNPNTAYLVYSNNPNQSGGGDHGKTPEDKNVVFTYKVVVNKKDEENHSLQGAQFELRKIVNDQDEGTKIDTVTVTEGTKFNFKGLDAGKYKLIETVTPSGYNTIQPIIFTIEATYDEESDDPQLTSLTGQTEGEIVFIRKTEEREDSLSTDVINKKGIQLPETGGMGRYLIYTLGTIFVLTALGYTVYKRNRKHTEK